MTAPSFDACPTMDGGAGKRPRAACLPGHERQRVERVEGWIPGAAQQDARPAASAAGRHG